jgi:hypothetical protein
MMKELLVAVVTLVLMTGCAPNATFVYKPSASAAGVSKSPVKIAVLPFADGTENSTREVYKVNLAKSAAGNLIDPLPPEYWAKALADEMAASDRFESVRFVYDQSELTDENYIVEGTLEKAYLYFSPPTNLTNLPFLSGRRGRRTT